MAGRRSHVMLSVFRCGETPWEEEGRLHGWTDLPLTEDGRARVTTDAGVLRGAGPSTIYHAPDEAAAETASVLARAASARARPIDDLADPNLGLLEGLLATDVSERYPKRFRQWEEDPLSLVPPEGEPLAEARARLFGAVARLLRKTRAAEIGVVLHPLGFGLLHCWFADRPAAHLWRVLEVDARVTRYAVPDVVLEALRSAAKPEAAIESS